MPAIHCILLGGINQGSLQKMLPRYPSVICGPLQNPGGPSPLHVLLAEKSKKRGRLKFRGEAESRRRLCWHHLCLLPVHQSVTKFNGASADAIPSSVSGSLSSQGCSLEGHTTLALSKGEWRNSFLAPKTSKANNPFPTEGSGKVKGLNLRAQIPSRSC